MLGMLQTILAANNNRPGKSWTQLLIIVVIVVVYGLKILSKAKKSFTEDEEEPCESPQPQQHGVQMPERKILLKSVPVPAEKIEIDIEPEPVRRKLSTLQESEQQEPPDIVLELDLDDTDSLRRAIIYSEILGKPLAMRQGD